MTRINVVPVTELHRVHLVSEYKEIVRVFGLVRKCQQSGINKYSFLNKKKPPAEYTLGTGHVLFMYDKLQFILNRYKALTGEMVSRGYKPSPIDEGDLKKGIDSWWFGEYTPTQKAIEINRKRIQDRLEGK